MKPTGTFLLYPQDRPEQYLEEHPTERWRCDLYPGDGSDHHGVGATKSEAFFNAASHYHSYMKKRGT